MPYTGSTTAGKVIAVKMNLKGDDIVVRRIRKVRNEFGQLGTVTHLATKGGTHLGATWRANATLGERLNKAMHSMTARFIGVAAAVALAYKGFRALQEFIGSGIQQFRDFEKSLAEVSTIISDLSRGDIYNLKSGIEELSVAYGKSVQDLSKGMYDILSAAFSVKDAFRLLTTATRASIAGLTSVSTSVDVFTSILNSYGKTVSQAAYISDVLFQSIIRGKFTFDEFAHALGYITPIAANAGVAFNEIAAALSTVTRMGLHLDMATRGLALAIQNIVSPTNKAAEAAAKYGVHMSSIALRVKGLIGFVKELNEKMQIYGAKIVPQIIRNMRSLRVIMALAGSEGIRGFTEDLELLETASGKTAQAMSKMMNVQQMQVDILEQSMNRVERSIGEAWGKIDIWFKKAQLWWATLLTGGDPGKAVGDFEKYVIRIRDSYLSMMKIQGDLAKQPRLITLLTGEEGNVLHTFKEVADIVNKAVDYDKIKTYLEISKKSFTLAETISDASVALENFKNEYDKFLLSSKKTGESASYDVEKLKAAYENIFNYLSKETVAKYMPHDLIQTMLEVAGGGAGVIGATGQAGAFSQQMKVKNTIDAMEKTINSMTGDLDAYKKTIMSLQPYYDEWAGGLDDLSDSINNHRENIIELENEIEKLSVEVEKPFVSLYSKMHGTDFGTYFGSLGYEIMMKREEASFSRFQMYTNMALKYGSKYINEYNSSMRDAIMTIYNYTKASNDMRIEQAKYNDSIKEYQLLMWKIELKGLKRRHGLTRGEEIRLKKLQIKMMEERISLAEKTIDKEKNVNESGYLEALNSLNRFVDETKLRIDELKDVRDSEIEYLEEQYERKSGDLKEYTALQINERKKLEISEYTYLNVLKSVNPEIAKLMEETYGVNIPSSIQKSIDKIVEFRKLTPGVGAMKPEYSTGGGGNWRIAIGAARWAAMYRAAGKPVPHVLESLMKWSGYQGGSYFVPQTKPYILHEGERVIPRGRDTSKQITVKIEPIHVNAVLRDETTLEQFGNKIGQAISAGFISGLSSEFEVG